MAVAALVSELTRSVHMPDGALDALVGTLRQRGFVVIAPVARDDVITLGPVETGAEIAAGWTDTQEPGRYRATSDGGDRGTTALRFAHAAPARPWKRWLHPERTLLVRTRAEGAGAADLLAESEPAPLAFVGVQACDLAAIDRLDAVLHGDEGYARRRAGLLTVAAACTTPASTCFCASAGTGPMPGPPADIVMVELDDATLLATANSAAGEELLAEIGAVDPAPADRIARAAELVERGERAQTRHLDPDAIAAAAAAPDHPGWAEVAERCLTCGNCTFQCPTCFCTSTEDAVPLDGAGFERRQQWDSCFSLDFSHVHGGPVRSTAVSRYRQWYLHKLVTWHDQFGASGCVGCGRCVTWCPTGIDLTEAVIR